MEPSSKVNCENSAEAVRKLFARSCSRCKSMAFAEEHKSKTDRRALSRFIFETFSDQACVGVGTPTRCHFFFIV
ncbi:hypothetical protein D3C87_2067800 [compost metagenome]